MTNTINPLHEKLTLAIPTDAFWVGAVSGQCVGGAADQIA